MGGLTRWDLLETYRILPVLIKFCLNRQCYMPLFRTHLTITTQSDVFFFSYLKDSQNSFYFPLNF